MMPDHLPKIAMITGTGRSGTNVTKAMLSRHPQCGALPFEYRFTIDPGGIVDFLYNYPTAWSPFRADKMIRDLESFLLHMGERDEYASTTSKWIRKHYERGRSLSPYPYADWELDQWMPGYSSYVRDLIDNLVEYRYHAVWPGAVALAKDHEMYYAGPMTQDQLVPKLQAFIYRCIHSYLTSQQKEVFVEDNTWSGLYADGLLRLYPSAKMIFVKRDHRDVIASLVRQRWTPDELRHVCRWYRDVIDSWEAQKARLKTDSWIELRFEDMISDPQAYAIQLCQVLEIDYDPQMIDLDLSRANIGRHQSDFTSAEIAIIDQIVLGK